MPATRRSPPPLPEDLLTLVTEGLEQHRDWSWDQPIAELVREALPDEEDDDDDE